MTGPVHIFAKALWATRETRSAELSRDVRERLKITQEMYQAVQEEWLANPDYDPEADVRIAWARQILVAWRVGVWRMPTADTETEGQMEWLMVGWG